MPITSKHLYVASMDVDPDKEALFNDVYNNEHVPLLSEVPGVLSIARFQREEELAIIVGGEKRTIRVENEPKYTALYELESPDVLTSEAWAEAVDRGRWPEQVRPYTRNKRYVMMKLIYPK